HNAGSEIPPQKIVNNNSYVLREISQKEAQNLPHARFFEEEIYISEKNETEPARTYQTIFCDTEGRFYLLKVSVPTVETQELQLSIISAIAILIAILLIVLLLVNYFVFRREMKPFYLLLKWFKHYTIGQKDTKIPETQTNITEFQQLYEVVGSGVKKNEIIFEQQKQFISNASHELQTPLAVCKNRLEMLLENENRSKNDAQDIAKIHEQIDKIIKLNKTLLFLTKIDNGQFIENKEIDFSDLIFSISSDYKEIFSHKNIDFRIETIGIFQFSMNEALAASLISNLLKNAFVYSAEKGKIVVKIFNGKIIFQNSGNTPLDKNLIFNRFYTVGKNENSSGLGLSIAKSICRNYNLKIDYDFSNSEHIFTIKKL
ncbi:MAG: HAMP domain-containing histidine kinase, partial [Paludibacter sp.]|nr:HAMP domain-containing histidine kinase [Paludibacter sp.]